MILCGSGVLWFAKHMEHKAAQHKASNNAAGLLYTCNESSDMVQDKSMCSRVLPASNLEGEGALGRNNSADGQNLRNPGFG